MIDHVVRALFLLSYVILVHVAWSLVICGVFEDHRLFSCLFSFGHWAFFDLRLLITPMVSSKLIDACSIFVIGLGYSAFVLEMIVTDSVQLPYSRNRWKPYYNHDFLITPDKLQNILQKRTKLAIDFVYTMTKSPIKNKRHIEFFFVWGNCKK